GRGELEPVDVDVGRELDHLVAHPDRVGVEGAARHVDGLVEVVRGGRRPAVAPERVHRLLAVEPVARREREQLDELARLLQPPGALGNGDAVDAGGEAAQQGQSDIGHPGGMIYDGAARSYWKTVVPRRPPGASSNRHWRCPGRGAAGTTPRQIVASGNLSRRHTWWSRRISTVCGSFTRSVSRSPPRRP